MMRLSHIVAEIVAEIVAVSKLEVLLGLATSHAPSNHESWRVRLLAYINGSRSALAT